MKKNKLADAKKLEALNKGKKEKQKKILEQIRENKIGNNQAILHELFICGIHENISLENLIDAGFKDNKAVKSDSTGTGSNPLLERVLFHERTHYGLYDLVCIDNNFHRFNIIKTGSSFQKAGLLNSIRDQGRVIEAFKDACTESRFENNTTMEKYYEEMKKNKIKELEILKSKLKRLEEEEKEDSE
jgi:hypothetical protein